VFYARVSPRGRVWKAFVEEALDGDVDKVRKRTQGLSRPLPIARKKKKKKKTRTKSGRWYSDGDRSLKSKERAVM
jgi:hypothetical protein